MKPSFDRTGTYYTSYGLAVHHEANIATTPCNGKREGATIARMKNEGCGFPHSEEEKEEVRVICCAKVDGLPPRRPQVGRPPSGGKTFPITNQRDNPLLTWYIYDRRLYFILNLCACCTR